MTRQHWTAGLRFCALCVIGFSISIPFVWI